MTTEDFQADVQQERRDEERAARQRADAIATARDDLVTAMKNLRRIPRFTLEWLQHFDHLSAITDRLNELEGDAR